MSSKKSSDPSKREVSVTGMSFLRGSANYVWCTTSVLGKGATAAVFQGVNRHTGEPVAVKTFNQLSHMRPQEVQMREFEVLQKVNHENIVKLLAIEEEQDGRGKVIVMELCTGGSLFNLLDDPENNHGLNQIEFLLVLEHLAAGMKHLRDNNLVHRDLKPGNIMKFIDDAGSTVYKLTDFGAARELQDDQQFMSLYGTEEYLHPDMYERAVLRKPVGKTFGAGVDLWSIGVTLYHVATGQLPFRPHGGRRNRETMYQIITEKDPGVISGVQTTENGPIDWSRHLPETCQLALGVRNLVTPLLAGLLEVDENLKWDFTRFFQEVTTILSKTPIFIFYVNKVQPLIVHMETNHRYEELQYLICEQTGMDPRNQLLIYESRLLLDIVGEDLLGPSFPTTNPKEPIVLFSKQDDDIVLTLPEAPSLRFPAFPNTVSVEHDAAAGKTICSVGYAIKRRIDYFAKCVNLTEYSVLMFIDMMVRQVENLNERVKHLQNLTSAVSMRFKQLVTNHRKFMMLTQMVTSNQESTNQPLLHEKLEDLINNEVDAEKAVCESLKAIVPVITQLYERVVVESQLRRQWHPNYSQDNVYVGIEKTPNKAGTHVTKLRESWQHLLRDRAARTLTFNDEQFHLLEKMKMKEKAKCLENLLSSATTSLHYTTDNLADWCKVAKVQRVQAEIEEADVNKHEKLLENFQQILTNTEDRYHHTLSDLLATMKDKKILNESQMIVQDLEEREEVPNDKSYISEKSKSKNDDAYKAKFKQKVQEMHESQDQMMQLIEMNNLVIEALQLKTQGPR